MGGNLQDKDFAVIRNQAKLARSESRFKNTGNNLNQRLEKTETEPNIIPGFISNPASTIRINPQMYSLNMSKRLHLLGWDGFEMEVSVYPHYSKNNYQEIKKCYTLFLQLS